MPLLGTAIFYHLRKLSVKEKESSWHVSKLSCVIFFLSQQFPANIRVSLLKQRSVSFLESSGRLTRSDRQLLAARGGGGACGRGRCGEGQRIDGGKRDEKKIDESERREEMKRIDRKR
jgi:hypothetical protein